MPPTPHAQSKGRAQFQRVLEAVISLAFLALALRGIRLDALWAALRDADYGWVLPFIAVTEGVLALKTLRWQLLFRPEHRLPFGAAFAALTAGYLASNVLPARAGEVVRLALLISEQPVGAARTASTIIVERVLDLLTLLVVLVLLLPFVQLPADMTAAAQSLGVLALVGAAALVLASFWKARLLGWAERIFRRVRFLDRPGIYSALGHLIDGFVALRGPLGPALIGLSLLGWVGVVVIAWTAGQAFHLDAPLTAYVFAVVVTSLGMVVPSSPGYVGVFHFLTTVALAPFGVAKDQALSFALVWHGLNYLTLSLTGALALWIRGTSVGQALARWRGRQGIG
jgi:hypothetical protein